ncbi:MAG: MFS transporter [Gammaproteobacteria bacterium]|nr:MFS transporter [Gammaproteobacteria bacterium]
MNETRPDAWPKPAYAWYVVVLLVLSYALGVVDRIVIGLLVNPIKEDLQLTDTEIGIIQGLAFALFYSLFTLPVGYLVDRWKRVPVVWGGLAIWSVATMAGAFSRSFWGLFASRVVMGAGEATTTPASASLIADYFPPEKRARAYGIFAMGGSIGIGIAYLLGGVAIGLTDAVRSLAPSLFAPFADWHVVLFIVGAPGIVLAALMALTMREPARRGAVSQPTRFSLLPLWRELAINRVALITVMMGTIMNVMIVNAQLAWFPTLFVRVHEWEPARIALALSVVGVPFGILSAITAGSALTWLAKRGRQDGPVLVMMLQCAAWALFGTAKCLAPTPELALVGHVLTSMFATWAVTSALTALNLVTPNQLRGQVVAVYTLLTGLVGIAVGSGAVGFLSDYVFNYPTGIAPSLALVCFLGGAIGIAILGFGRAGYLAAVRRAAAFT